ncbi:hypothetical protein [Halobaculum gomorrense]|nr:hypothetical protein [Halobaculum gomorrense]
MASRIKSLVGAGDDHDFEFAGREREFGANNQQCAECDGSDIRRI